MTNNLKKVTTEFEIVEFADKKTLTVKKEKEKIIFYDELVVEEYIDKKFTNKYKKLLYIIMDINNNDDSTESDAWLVRNQIDELKNTLINKYSKHINRELLNKYLKMLLLLEDKLVIPERSRGR